MKSAIHHITAICSNAQKNYNFYTEILGLRLVKKTVNFDSPDSYHLYYGNESGEPGTILTFFAFPQAGTGMRGIEQVTKIQFVVPQKSLQFWIERFIVKNVKYESISKAFGNSTLKFYDPDGLQLELVQSKGNLDLKPYTTEDITEQHAIRGIFGAELAIDDKESTKEILTSIFNYSELATEGFITRLVNKNSKNAKYIDLFEMKGWTKGIQSAGTVHHIAFAAKDSEHQLILKEKVTDYSLNPTEQIDRKYFKSVYFREPNNILFEIATYQPGFTVDETIEHLGSKLMLPKQYEHIRNSIQEILPELYQSKITGESFLGENYEFIFKKITGEDKTIILFHGTGGDELNLIPLARNLNDKYSILSLRGNVTEHGMNRFFERTADGTFNYESIKIEAEKFVKFIEKIDENFINNLNEYIFVGFSNGANFILSILLLYPEYIKNAVLFHPLIPFTPNKKLELKDKNIFITSGEFDEYLRNPDEIENLSNMLKSFGANVDKYITQSNHVIMPQEVTKAKDFLTRLN